MYHLLFKASLIHVFGSWSDKSENKWSVYFDGYQSITVSYTCLALSRFHCVAHYLLCWSFPINLHWSWISCPTQTHCWDGGTLCLLYICQSNCSISIASFPKWQQNSVLVHFDVMHPLVHKVHWLKSLVHCSSGSMTTLSQFSFHCSFLCVLLCLLL